MTDTLDKLLVRLFKKTIALGSMSFLIIVAGTISKATAESVGEVSSNQSTATKAANKVEPNADLVEVSEGRLRIQMRQSSLPPVCTSNCNTCTSACICV